MRRKVAGSVPGEVMRFFNLRNTSIRTVAQGFTQPLSEMSSRNLLGSAAPSGLKLATSLPSVSRLTSKCGILYVSQPYELPRPVNFIPYVSPT
jgi:hypothetical protein